AAPLVSPRRWATTSTLCRLTASGRRRTPAAAVAPPVTVTLADSGAKPSNRTRSAYDPAGTLSMRNEPSSRVRVPSGVPATRTDAPTTALAVVSVTRPVMAPLGGWAPPRAGNDRVRQGRNARRRGRGRAPSNVVG